MRVKTHLRVGMRVCLAAVRSRRFANHVSLAEYRRAVDVRRRFAAWNDGAVGNAEPQMKHGF